jgi:predicted transcriptional regulator
VLNRKKERKEKRGRRRDSFSEGGSSPELSNNTREKPQQQEKKTTKNKKELRDETSLIEDAVKHFSSGGKVTLKSLREGIGVSYLVAKAIFTRLEQEGVLVDGPKNKKTGKVQGKSKKKKKKKKKKKRLFSY